jgi:predicted amidohydrolase
MHAGCRLLVVLALGLTSALLHAVQPPDAITFTIAQTAGRRGQFEANLSIARAWVKEALLRDSQFLFLPAGFLTGHLQTDLNPAEALSHDDPALRRFIQESTNHSMVIVVGLVRRAGTNHYDTALVIHQGRLLGHHDRIHLSPTERAIPGLGSGTAVPVFQAHGVRFTVLIGVDAQDLHANLAARWQGAEMLVALEQRPAGPKVSVPALRLDAQSLARHQRWFVASVNRSEVGDSSPHLAGGSCLLDPEGVLLAEAADAGSQILTARIPTETIHRTADPRGLVDSPVWLRHQLAELLLEGRRPRTDDELRGWLENLTLHHRFSIEESARALDMSTAEVTEARNRLGIREPPAGRLPTNATTTLRVLPYPGGRHPRIGFFDGAVAPQRETKVSVFLPWSASGYAVVDVPEAIFSNLGLTYLAHSHIPTLWDRQGIRLTPTEWRRADDGTLSMERTLPNGIAFGSAVTPAAAGVRFHLWLRNGTSAALTGLLSMNLRTQRTSSQRDEGHLTGPISNSGGPCRAATGQSRPGSSSVCSSERNWDGIADPGRGEADFELNACC